MNLDENAHINLDENAHNNLVETHTYTSRLDYTHHHHYSIMNNNQQINSIGFTITYQTPYNDCEWRTQSFTTKEEAERMVNFYKSCGVSARLV